VIAVPLTLAPAEDLERRHEPNQLPRVQQVLGAAGARSGLRLRAGEGLAEEDAAGAQRAPQRRKQRPVEVVEDEHQLPLALAQVHLGRFEVHNGGLDR
jgi:hypothetical protein